MSSKALVVVALVGAAGLAAWRFWPQRGSAPEVEPKPAERQGTDPESGSGAAGARTSVPEAGIGAMPPGPVRMRSGRRDDSDEEGAPRRAMSDRFAGETRKPEWAEKREAEVDARAREILAAAARDAPAGAAAVTAGKAECREHTCRFQLRAGDTRSLARALEWLGDPNGFAGSAEDMLVEAVERGEDGPRVVNLFLRYAR